MVQRARDNAWGSPSVEREHTGVFPGINSAQKIYLEVTPTYLGPGPAVEGGAKACPDKAAEKDTNASPGTALKGGNANGNAVDGFLQVE